MFTCEFCGEEFDTEGIEDLEPLCDEGYCCEQCYYLYVIPAKMQQMREEAPDDEEDDSSSEGSYFYV